MMDANQLAEIEARAKAAIAEKGARNYFFMCEQLLKQDIPELAAHIRDLEAALRTRAITLGEAWPDELQSRRDMLTGLGDK